MRRFKSWLEGMVVGLIVLAMVFLTLLAMIRLFFPDLSSQKKEIEAYLSVQLEAPVTIKAIALHFSGIEPELLLEDVSIEKNDLKFHAKKMVGHLHLIRSLVSSGWRILHWPNPDVLFGDFEIKEVKFIDQEKELFFQRMKGDVYFKRSGDDFSVMFSRLALTQANKTSIQPFFMKLSFSSDGHEPIYDIQAKDVPLEITYLLEPLFPLSTETKQLLNGIKAKGVMGQFVAEFKKENLSFFMVKVYNFSTEAYKNYPSIRQADFQIDYTPDKAKITFLGNEHTELHFPAIFQEPFVFKSIAGEIFFWMKGKDLVMRSDLFKVKLDDAQMLTSFTFDSQKDFLSLQSKIEGNVKSLRNLIPITFNKSAHDWLENAFVLGKIHAADVVFEGKLSDFPFLHNEGALRFAVATQELALRFDPTWPLLTEMNGLVVGDGCNLSIKVPYARTMDVDITHIEAKLTELCTEGVPGHLSVQGDIKGKFHEGVNYLLNSPLKNPLGDALAGLNLQGDFNLALGLDVAISEKAVESQVKGHLKTEKADLALPGTQIRLQKIAGDFDFTENSLHATNVTAMLLDFPLDITIDSEVRDDVPNILIAANVNPTVTQIEKAFDVSLSDMVRGQTPILVKVTLPLKDPILPQLTFESHLQGLEILLPPPFKKNSDEEKFFVAEPVFEKENISGWYFSFDKKTHVALGQKIDGIFPVNLFFGDKRVPIPTEPGLLISGVLDDFSLSDADALSSSSDAVLPFLGADVMIHSLKLADTVFKDVAVDLRKSKDSTRIYLKSAALAGAVFLFEGTQKHRARVILDRLNLHSAAEQQTTFSLKPNVLKKFLPLEFSVNQLKMDHTRFGRLYFMLIPQKETDLNIQTLKINGPLFKLTGQGHWQTAGTQLQGTMSTTNLGELLDVLGDSKFLQGGTGEFHYALSWPGAPTDFSLKQASGLVNTKMTDGQLLGVNPGLGRLFSLLSIDEWQRRIQLNFKDVINKGFAFTSVAGDFLLTDGNAVTERVEVKGSAADMTMKGSFDLAKSTLDLDVLVIPNVNAGLPIAAAVAAANPAVGAAVWVFDKLFAPEIGKIAQNRYLITGTFKDPVMKREAVGGVQNKASPPMH